MKKNLLTTALCVFFMSTVWAAAPTITSFSPSSGPVGTLVTINGTNLGSPTAFSIGGKTAIVITGKTGQIVGMVMPGATTGGISVTTSGGTVASSGSFTVSSTAYPTQQQGNKLIGTTVGQSEQGFSVAVSADGNTAVTGGLHDNNDVGAIWIYTRSGGIWAQQGTKLVGTGGTGTLGNQQGVSVAISADGNTVVEGGPADNNNVGAFWTFTRSNGVWTQQGNKVSAADFISKDFGSGPINPEQGSSIAISGDGNTVIEGGYWDNDLVGAAWVYTRQGGVWTEQKKLVDSTGIGSSQGFCVAMSTDGNTAAVGGSTDNNYNGAVWIYIKGTHGWTRQVKLIGTGATSFAGQGASAALSADGNTLAEGANFDNNETGAVWIFTRTGTAWTQQGGKLSPPESVAPSRQGNSVSLSADGNTLIEGGYRDNGDVGGAWIFTRAGGSWTQKTKLFGTGGTTGDDQGYSVAISADGSTAFSGAISDSSIGGAIFAFSAVSIVQPQTITFAKQPAPIYYGGINFSPGATASSGLPITYTSSNAAVATIVAGKVHIVGAGTTNITASQPGNASYAAATSVVQGYTISKAPLTITVQNQYGVTGQPLPGFFVTYTGLVYSDTQSAISGLILSTTAPATGASSGTYPITASGATAVNYVITYVPGTLTLVSLAQIATPFPAKFYGDPDFYCFGTSTPTINYTTDNAAVATIVAGKIHITGVGSVNITISNGSNNPYTKTLTVQKRDLLVSAANQFGLQGSSILNTELPIIYAGFVNGEDERSLTVQPTCTTTATSASPPGDYPVTPAGGVSPNYNFVYVTGTLTVVPLSALLTPFDVKMYGDPDFYEFGRATPYETYTSNNPLVATIVNGAIHITGAGTATITVNSNGQTLDKVLTVMPALLRVQPDNQTKLQGTANPVFTISYSGFVNGDTPATGLTTLPVATTTAVTTSVAGTYPITASGGVSTKYSFAYVDGTLTVTAPTGSGTTTGFAAAPQVKPGISPNGDGINDVLTINNIEKYPDNKITLINQSGTKVYEITGYDNKNKAFTGYSNISGKLQKEGTYFYVLQYHDNGLLKSETGYFIIKY